MSDKAFSAVLEIDSHNKCSSQRRAVYSDQRLTLEELIIGYTRDAAYVEFKENEKGQIKEGFLADFVLFSHDLFDVNAEEILSARPVLTMIDGRVVYEA